MVDRSAAEEIKSKLNIVDIIREYVPELKKHGQNYFGLCPFHAEKTPSFSVNEQMQIFKCFGCGQSGDMFTFVEKIEHLPFPEALEKLGARAGVDTERFSVDPGLKKSRDQILAINRLTQKFFHFFLKKHKFGNIARDYLKKRGINGELIEKFGIGWDPGRELVLTLLQRKGFKNDELMRAGIAKTRNGQRYSAFWERVVFPVYDVKGEPVAFNGRVIEKERMPKYLNSPDTDLYRKGKILYALNWAKNAIGKDGFAIVTEGAMNVVASHKVGRENIVASLGTGFTKQHATLLKRYTDTVHLALDNDTAGKTAMMRAIPILFAEGLDVKVIEITIGKDVDDMVSADPKAWLVAAVSPKESIDWVIEQVRERIDISSVPGKSHFTSSLRPFVSALKDPVSRDLWVKRIADEVGVKPETVDASLKQGDRVAVALGDDVSPDAVLRKEQIERFLLGLLIQNWNLLAASRGEVKLVYLSKGGAGGVLRELIGEEERDMKKETRDKKGKDDKRKGIKSEKQPDLDTVLAKLSQNNAELCKEVALMSLNLEEVDILEVWREALERLKQKRLSEVIGALRAKISSAESSGETKQAQKYLEKIQRLTSSTPSE